MPSTEDPAQESLRIVPVDDYVIDLADIRATDVPRVGPKAARLGQLAADGWQVPDGYAVTVDALGDWLRRPAACGLPADALSPTPS